MTRLWLYEKTGQSYWLRPGLRTMGAVDNLAGYYNAVYKVRHDIEKKYRMNGTQLQISDDFKAMSPEEQRAAVNDAKMEEFKEAFYNDQPTEAQRIAYRKETGIKPEFLDDQGIDDLIMEKKVAEKYGALNLNSAYAGDAKAFSEEMRFANRPASQAVASAISTTGLIRSSTGSAGGSSGAVFPCAIPWRWFRHRAARRDASHERDVLQRRHEPARDPSQPGNHGHGRPGVGNIWDPVSSRADHRQWSCCTAW